ncbi:MAG TPA: prenyltransferase [Gaiellales bacterium]|nr:prenyltransferase [Gaiellales bacterium]
MGKTLRAVWLEVRVIPVLLWSFSALTLGTALAAARGGLAGWYYAGAVVLGVLIQGLVAHTVNELEDWRSGTDRHPSPRLISGGSKVIVSGLITTRGLRRLLIAALAATTALGLALVWARGPVVLPFGLLGVAGAVAYSQPPLRAAYRPLAGEAVAFLCVVVCVVGAHVLQGPTPDATALVAAVAVAAYAVSMLMVHHYLDREADRSADPPKLTTIVWLGPVRGRRYAIGWCLVALAAAIAASAGQPRLLPLAAGYAAGLAAHLRCRPDDVGSVTACETVIIVAGIAGALLASVLLAPALWWAVAGAAAVFALESRLAPTPAGTVAG